MASKFIVIEGLDGSGKATQTKILCDKLSSLGKNIIKLTFPDYDSPSSSLVKMYLQGELGADAMSINPYAASSFYAVDRVASYIKSWKTDFENADFTVSDRYATSNIIYQMSKVDKNSREEFIDWLDDFEYKKLGVPKPDLVIFLDVNPAISQKLMTGRYNGDENKKDIHEKNVNFLNSCRESAKFASDYLGWKVIDCCDENSILSIEEISKMIFDTVNDEFNLL